MLPQRCPLDSEYLGRVANGMRQIKLGIFELREL